MMLFPQLSAYVLRITLEATEPVLLGPYPGSALRGALLEALFRRFCVNPAASSCQLCPLHMTCSVAGLVAPLREEHPRGRDVPRPFVISLPMAADSHTKSVQGYYEHLLQPGAALAIELTLLGKASRFFPYVALSLPTLEELGLGRRLEGREGRRGRVRVLRVEAVEPLSGMKETLYNGTHLEVARPSLHVSAEMVAQRARQLSSNRLALHFLTPTRLVGDGHLWSYPAFRPLVLRLAERLEELEMAYGEGGAMDPKELREGYYQRYARFSVLADQVQLISRQTQWVELASYSGRQQRTTPIGGFIGQAAYEGDLSVLRELLVWGEVVHVGKNAVKGDGYYRISGGSSDADWLD